MKLPPDIDELTYDELIELRRKNLTPEQRLVIERYLKIQADELEKWFWNREAQSSWQWIGK